MIPFPSKKFSPRVTVTSATPYVNGVKHLGNIVGSILPADVFHRFLDVLGVENIFICGTDEHGTPTELAAREAGIPVEEYANKYHHIQKVIYEKWNFDFTYFGRSSGKSNHEITQKLFLAMYENGYIKKEEVVVPYCNQDKRFLPDRYINGTCPHCAYERARGDQCERCGKLLDPEELHEPYCSLCQGKDISFKNEHHLFLNFPLLQDKLKAWIEQTHWPDNTKNFALGWIHEGLKPRCITRNISWGIPVPLKGYEHVVFYVWFDAANGYIAMTKDAEKAGKIENWKQWWTDAKIIQFMGKDNIPFHTIFWPGMLIAGKSQKTSDTNFTLPYEVHGYEYLNWEGKKFSTSQGVGLFSDEALELFPADYWRYYLTSILPESKDANFSWDDFAHRINNELIANYGNLFYRVTHFIQNTFEGKVPKPEPAGAEENALQEILQQTLREVQTHIEAVKLREALRAVMALAGAANKYFQEKQPWKEPEKTKVATTLYYAANTLRVISVLLLPVIPASAKRALDALHSDTGTWEWLHEETLQPGHVISATLLFEKIETQDIEKAKTYKTTYAKKKHTHHGQVSHMDFTKLDIRMGTITDVNDHPHADRLYILTVDVGNQKIQIVNGMKPYKEKNELKGKQVPILLNLEPKEFRGVKSQGMLLACDDATLLLPEQHVKNGEKIC